MMENFDGKIEQNEMKNKIALFTYSHSDYEDVWEAYMGRMKKHGPNINHYIFLNKNSSNLFDNCNVVLYNEERSYRERLLQCLPSVKEKYVIFSHEDMILFSDIDVELLQKLIEYLDQHKETSAIKLIKGGEGPFIKIENSLNLVANVTGDYNFAVQPTIWRTASLMQLLSQCTAETIWQLEIDGSQVLRGWGTMAVLTVAGAAQRRGKHHWDSEVWPFIATAVVKGKWNVKEYPIEMKDIFEEFNIVPTKRGTNEKYA